ncbi:uromodulin-like 1 [Cyclopterus lumpus]|uniref:uromodulin-like 1 n=1 Tax=Cyclopterus lumpus TaxID=8103 RepID=UPI0014868D40|nr:uromodulin-like 1 [Cyclopterus lumpus]
MYGWDFDLWKMSWMLSVWVATALLALSRGQNTVNKGNSLSASGYHLCVHNETRNVSFLVMHAVPYTVMKPCGGWLHWKTCTVTLYRMTHQTERKTVMEQVIGCCSGYEQVGRYCARPVNRSDELTAKPGSCSTADGLCPRSEDCEWDMDCPGWQKCCRFLCTDPTSSANYSETGGNQFNATVTVKTDYLQLMSSERGLLNHTRLLQAMVTGALQSDVSVYYLSSQPVHPYRSATSLLIGCNFALSLHNVTSKLHHLLKHIQEVTSVTVEDVDECAQSALRQCSLHADCNNTVGSYRCACNQGFIDVDPRNPGAHCTADVGATTTTEPLLTSLTPTKTDPLSMNSTVEPPLQTTECSPPRITNAWSANVTATSFRVYWSSRCQTVQTYQVVLRRRSEVVQSWMTNQTLVEMKDLQPGALYNVSITPCSCRSQGVALGISIKTDARTLDATARLTNIRFTDDLLNTSSQAYENLTESIMAEIYQTLSPEMKAMVDSGQVRIDIRSFSPGSVVVNFTIVFAPSQSQDIDNMSTALLHSLMNSTKYTVDKNKTGTNDFNECASGENDCSHWATCTNAWASYTCSCRHGFIDNNPERPGRACQEIATAPPTNITDPTANITDPTANITDTTTNNTDTTTNITDPTTNITTNITAPPTNITDPTTNITDPITNITAPTTNITAPPTNITAPPTNITAPPTNITAPPTNITAPPTNITDPTTNITDPITNITAPTTNITAQTTNITDPTTNITAPPITTTTPITSTAVTTTTTTTATAMISKTSTSTITVASPTTTISAPVTPATFIRAAKNILMMGAISVQCRVAAITVTVAKDFLVSNKIREQTLYLGLRDCTVNGGNTSHAQLTVAWNECNTSLVHNETYYTTSVTLFNIMDMYTSDSGEVEVPRIRLEAPIICTYTKSMLISTDFGSMGYDIINDFITGSGLFQVTVQLTNGIMLLPKNHSLSSDETVVVEVSLNTSSEQMKVVINKCWATPTPTPTQNPKDTFLENSCSLNPYTNVLMNGNSSTSRVSVQIFSIVNLDVIYLHCLVHICVETGSDTCVPDCQTMQRTARSSKTIGTAVGSSGALLKLNDESLEQGIGTLYVAGLSCLGIGLTLFVIIGFVCIFYFHRNRIGHYNFSVKPKQETFTYIVFNT